MGSGRGGLCVIKLVGSRTAGVACMMGASRSVAGSTITVHFRACYRVLPVRFTVLRVCAGRGASEMQGLISEWIRGTDDNRIIWIPRGLCQGAVSSWVPVAVVASCRRSMTVTAPVGATVAGCRIR